MKAEFDFQGGRSTGEVVKESRHTVWVKVPHPKIADKKATIKRHKVHHNVRMEEGKV